ncbi:MAG: sigma 54-interacting transcriptional regulator [Deltaproteobacteria bacterium]|jgi:formate hydrogenlyase transcriptional activator|nr:sigma 54-interacting transcriptional regulator [Deltaproteobacteria bacterium]
MDSINQTILQNITLLDDSYRLLSIAAIFNEKFTIDWLGELTDIRPTQLLEILEKEESGGRIIKKGPGTYAFIDIQTRDSLLNTLPKQKIRHCHLQIVTLLRDEIEVNDNIAVMLSHHLMQISNDYENCRYLTRVGDIHLRKYDNETAFQCYTKTLEDLVSLEGEDVDLLFLEATFKYSKLSTGRHNTDKVLAILHDAIQRAVKLRNKSSEALLLMHIAKNEWFRANYTASINCFDKGWQLAQELNDPKLNHAAKNFNTFFLYWQGRFQEVVATYEKGLSEVETLPEGRFSLLAAIIVGYCYTQVGMLTQGLGMLDTIRAQCLERGDLYLAAFAAGNIGNIMVGMRRWDDALDHLKQSFKEAEQTHNDWISIQGLIIIAFVHYSKGNKKLCIKYINEFLDRSRKVHITVDTYPYLLELAIAMEYGDLPKIQDISMENEIRKKLHGKNIYMKGVAYRYKSYWQQMEKAPVEKIRNTLKLSLKWLHESGNVIEIAKSKLELTRLLLSVGENEEARKVGCEGIAVLGNVDEALVPDDLRNLMGEPPHQEHLLAEILEATKEIALLGNQKDLMKHVIKTVNRLTGAERGAVFLYENNSTSNTFRLLGSKNLTKKQIEHPSFTSSMELIQAVARSGKAHILGDQPNRGDDENTLSRIRSCVCVPILLRNETVGVLYLDNRLLSSTFKESHLQLLTYFATLSAISLDNSRAYNEIKRLNYKLNQEKQYYQEERVEIQHSDEIVGKSPAIMEVLAKIDQVSKTDATVMITGETGVGKELVAQAIYQMSNRQARPFIRVHCSALSETLIPSELFGHEKGAFTGATTMRIGRFELADTGTIFLDEMGEISADIQIRLLRVLQSGGFERVGGNRTLTSDFRLIVATNRHLENEVKAHRFRADLFYRLNVFPIHVPSLRERKEDVPLLALSFLSTFAAKMNKVFGSITEDDMKRLVHYDWPGNIRELMNVIERACILSTGKYIRIPELQSEAESPGISGDAVTLKQIEAKHIRRTLEQTGWKVRGPGGAAEILDIHPSTLAFRMKKLGIVRPKEKRS